MVLAAILVHLVMMVLVLGTPEAGTFETSHNHIGGDHILATVAHNMEILGLCGWLVVNCCVLCYMENFNQTVEHLQMTAVKVGNYTHAEHDIDWCVSQINCLCQRQLEHYYLIMLNCCPGIVASQIGNLVEPYWLSSVQIESLTFSANKDGWKIP